MDLINTGTDPWILEYEACETLSRDILEQLNTRSNQGLQPKEYDALSAKIRNRLKQFTIQVNQLDKKLKTASIVSSITNEEYERRRWQVDILQSNVIKLQDEFNKRKGRSNFVSPENQERSQLLGQKNETSALADMGTTSWRDIDSNESSVSNLFQGAATKTVDDLRADQLRLLREQDEGLDALSKIISRQKDIATTVTVEVEQQNEMLDDLSHGMGRIDARVQRETNMVRVIGRKSSTCGYWIVILLLLVAILGVSFA